MDKTTNPPAGGLAASTCRERRRATRSSPDSNLSPCADRGRDIALRCPRRPAKRRAVAMPAKFRNAGDPPSSTLDFHFGGNWILRLPHSPFPTLHSALRHGQPLDNQAPSSPIVPNKANLSIQQSTAPTIHQSKLVGSSVPICAHLWLNIRENSRNSRQVPPSSQKTITI
jgi:hypothetical protein